MVADIETALAPVTSALEADGFLAAIRIDDGTVHVRIDAGPDACAECLSPPFVLESLVADILKRNGYQYAVRLQYPEAWTGGESH
jgi:hypothetical protein